MSPYIWRPISKNQVYIYKITNYIYLIFNYRILILYQSNVIHIPKIYVPVTTEISKKEVKSILKLRIVVTIDSASFVFRVAKPLYRECGRWI